MLRQVAFWAREELDHIICLELGPSFLAYFFSASSAHRLPSAFGQITPLRLPFQINEAVQSCPLILLTGPCLVSAERNHFVSRICKGLTMLRQILNLGSGTWTLNGCSHLEFFRRLCKIFYTLDSDLFASRFNAQLPTYASWKPDPCALYGRLHFCLVKYIILCLSAFLCH